MFLKRIVQSIAILLCLVLTTHIQAQKNNPLINSGEKLREGSQFYQDQKYKEAEKAFSEVNRSDSNYASALLNLVNVYYADSMYDKAVEKSKLGMELFPEQYADFSMMLANAYDIMGKSKEAIEIYDDAIKHSPHNHLLYFNKAIAYIRLEEFDKAKNILQQSIMINPFFSQSHFFLGNMYFLEGSFVPSIMAYSTYLMMAPEGKYYKSVANMLSSISKVNDEVVKIAKEKKPDTEKSFNLIQEILLSKIALDQKYKSMVDIDDNIVKQLQVVVEKLEYKKSDKGFAMQFYVPLFTDLFKNKLYVPMVYTMFSGIELKQIQNWLQKNKNQKEAFISKANDYFNTIKATRVLDYNSRENVEKNYVYHDGQLIGYGSYKIVKKETLPTGRWQFFNKLDKLSSEGEFNNDGKKTGSWMFYYENGQKKEAYTYKDGIPDGKVTGWYNNGNLSYEETYTNGKLNGLQTVYFYNGLPKTIIPFKNDVKSGEVKYYNYKGKLTTTLLYADDKPDGKYSTYHENGKIKYEGLYVKGVETGEYKSYYPTGELEVKGMVKDDMRQGLWIEYYENGKEKSKTVYVDNMITGEFSEYYEDGTLSLTGKYVNKKLDGKTINYDKDGKMYSESVYEKGKLREISFYDKSGKNISTTTTRKGAAMITFYAADGVKSSEGFYNKDGLKEGKFVDYFKNGKVSAESNWKDGERNGSYTIYEPGGNKTYESNYVNGEEDGYVKSYFLNGKLKEEGWVVKGRRQQTWITYNINGDVYSKRYFQNGDPNGYTEYFYPGNVPDYEYYYSNDWLKAMKQFDTTGKVIQHTTFEKGEGTMTFRHFNGKVLSESNFKHYMLNGEKKSFYYDGSLSGKTNFLNDEKEGPAINYFFGGKVSSEGNYKFDSKDGKWKYYYRVAELSSEELYANGSMEGEKKFYNKDGTLQRIVSYKNSEVHGPMTYYGENNQVAIVLNFEEGYIKSYQYNGADNKLIPAIPVKHYSGKMKGLFANGKTSAEFEYIENNIQGAYTFYYSNGNIQSQGKMKNGYYDGTIKTFYPDGKLAKEENYILGALYGPTKLYFADGKPDALLNYYDGELQGLNKYYDQKTGKLSERTYYHGYIISIKE